MFRVAKSKIERARELTSEIDALINTTPPYTYCLETDTNSGQRATFAKKNINALDKVVIRCGDVFHNLRSALDQAYFESVSAHVPEKSHGALQFPFSKSKEKLESTIKSRLAHKVNSDFAEVIESVKPFSGKEGNLLLNLIHEVNIIDKHKLPIPTGEFTRISSHQLCSQIPDFPKGINNCGFGQNGRDVVWKGKFFDVKTLGEIVPPTNHLYHKALDVPVGLNFSFPNEGYFQPVIETLNLMSDEIERILELMAGVLPRET
ncbi:hypothetical protein [Shewanella benthica]|uniref:Uncharacterized protein n=1 Tax=Shewanella benthica KT99 TaxID=314608 RepID=A9EI81_9GAMM|nr:hypothetical protein [Shewanella benthica]EDP99778.1 hypothetical protein KT99_14179 [Shewanella benthica KT99]